MRRRLKRASLLALCAVLALPPASAAPAHQRGGDCISGNCVNGEGVVRLEHAVYTGMWAKSGFVAGRYRVTYMAYPGQQFELEVDASGFPLQGTVHRVLYDDKYHSPGLYTGSFDKLWHPFSRTVVPRYASGRYTDDYGLVYEGDFDYVPGKNGLASGGYYIFQGVRIDEAADEVRSGLYISDWTSNDVVAGKFPSYHPLTFHRAMPDYIAKLQDDLRADLQSADAEEAAKLAKERESSETWSKLFATAIGVAAVVGVAKLASRSSGSAAPVSTLGNTLSGKQSSPAASNKMVSDLRERAKSDPALAKRIGNSSDGEVVAMLQQAGRTPAPKMTLAEYRGATGKPAVAAGTAVASTTTTNDPQARQKARQEAIDAAAKEAKENTELAATERARKKAERDAAKKAEAETEQRAKTEYLRAFAAGMRLKAIACYGETSVVGSAPKIRPEVVGCVDVHYRAQCENSAAYTDGVADNFVGMGTGCFGDTYRVEPKPACKAAQVRVTIREARACGE